VNPQDHRFCGACGAPLAVRAQPEEGYRSGAERRQLTVVFSDLVDSSLLSTRLDPELLSQLILGYQRECTSVIERYDGYVVRYGGDAALAVFGFPRAYEDNPERAVRAGLDIISAVSALPSQEGALGDALKVRVGIATGDVVVGDLIGKGAAQERSVIGATPNLAARLQGLAVPNSVVIDASTRELLGERFEYMDLGRRVLHGFPDPVRAYRVMRARASSSRFEASRVTRLSPIVDREVYTSWLRVLWKEAQESHGRVALLCGEPGMGKSRIVEALREQLEGTPYLAPCHQCSPHYSHTALHPVIEQIERAAGITHETTPDLKLERLSKWLGSDDSPEALPLLAALLSIPTPAQLAIPPMSAERRKERTFEILIGRMARLAEAWPLPIVFEDVHWMDPTTAEFLTVLVERVGTMRALLVITFRPEFVPPWRHQPHVALRRIERLESAHALQLVEQVAGDELPKDVMREVAAKCDGVPLFIEELTRAVADAKPPEGSTVSARALRDIPATLKDSLMARLDQLGRAKNLAQVAGVIGRDFSYRLLEAVAQLPPERLRADMQTLEASGLVYAQPRLDGESYVFKHALVQETAYQSLLHSRRRELHALTAQALKTVFPRTLSDQPELLALHWTEAGQAEPATAHWLAAGERASRRSEYAEAIAHLQKGLELVPAIADAQLRRERELALRLALGPALITKNGGGTQDVADLYARAAALCTDTPESEAHFVAQWGAWRTSMNHREGRVRADTLLELARRLGEPQLLVQAHHCEWATLYMLGAHNECCAHVQSGLEVYELKNDRVYSALYGGHDAKVCGLGEAALAHWMLGRTEPACVSAREARAWADELTHVGSCAHAMDYALVLDKFRRDADSVQQRGEELMRYASRQRLRVHSAKGAFFHAWARATKGDVARGLDEMLKALESVKAADTPTDFPLYYEMLAEILSRAGRAYEGLHAIEQAFVIAERQGIVFWNAELHRRRGELHLLCGARDAARHAFDEALQCAQAQNARALELRAATSLARLLAADAQRETAAAILHPRYESFNRDMTNADLADARAVLEGLQ
jgi:class 3 adenylate cyclase/predicted ATPase